MRVVTPRWASSLRVWRVSSQATRSASARALASRGEASSRFPMGVAQTISLPSFMEPGYWRIWAYASCRFTSFWPVRVTIDFGRARSGPAAPGWRRPALDGGGDLRRRLRRAAGEQQADVAELVPEVPGGQRR